MSVTLVVPPASAIGAVSAEVAARMALSGDLDGRLADALLTCLEQIFADLSAVDDRHRARVTFDRARSGVTLNPVPFYTVDADVTIESATYTSSDLVLANPTDYLTIELYVLDLAEFSATLVGHLDTSTTNLTQTPANVLTLTPPLTVPAGNVLCWGKGAGGAGQDLPPGVLEVKLR